MAEDIWGDATERVLKRQGLGNILGEEDPVLARRASRLGIDLGLPAPAVNADLDGYEKEKQHQTAQSLFDYAPGLAAFAADPAFAAKAKDDLPTLAEISKALGTDQTPEENLTSQYVKRLKSSTALPAPLRLRGETFVASTPRTRYQEDVGGGSAFPIGVYAQGALSPAAKTLRMLTEAGARALGLSDELSQAKPWTDFTDSIARLDYDTTVQYDPVGEVTIPVVGKIEANPAQWAFSAATSITQLAVARGATGPGTLASVSTMSGADQYNRSRQRGASVEEALGAAALTGGIEAATEKLPLEYMFNHFGREGAGAFVKGLLFREVPTEVLATIGQGAVDARGTGGQGLEVWAQHLPQDIVDTIAATTLMVGGLGGGSAVARRLRPQLEDQADIGEALAGAQFLDGIMTNAESSKLKAEDPAGFRDFVERHAENTPVRNVFIPAEAVATYMQSEGYDGSLDRFSEQIAEAQATSGDVVIPVADAATYLAGTPAWAALREEARITPGGFSQREAQEKSQELFQSLEAEGKAMAEQAEAAGVDKAAIAEVKEEIKNAILATGRVKSSNADAVAEIAAHRYALRGSQRGQTPMQAWEEAKVSFLGVEASGKERGRQLAQPLIIGDLSYSINEEGGYRVSLSTPEQSFELGEALSIGDLRAHLGDEITARVLAGEGVESEGQRSIGNLDLAVPEGGGLAVRRELYQSQQEEVFYSALERAVRDSKQAKATGAQWLATLRKTPGVKQEELEWTGLIELLQSTEGSITRDQLVELLENGGIQLDEVMLGGDRKAALDRGIRRLMADMNWTYEQAEAAWMDDPSIRFEDMDNQPQFTSWSSDPSNPTYRELLLTLPIGERGNPARAPSTHWDVEGVVAHTRFMDKTDADGKRVLFVEEIQSDWHQKGRDQGYEAAADPVKLKAVQDELAQREKVADQVRLDFIAAVDALVKDAQARNQPGVTGDRPPSEMALASDALKRSYAEEIMERIGESADPTLYQEAYHELRALSAAELRANEATQAVRNAQQRSGIPNAPFKSSWPALVMKRLIRYAAENGYERAAWTTGEEQAERYNLSTALGEVRVEKRPDGRYLIDAETSQGRRALEDQGESYQPEDGGPGGVLMSPEKINEVFGRDLGGRILGTEEVQYLSGEELKIGGEGMKAFYDRNLVNITNDIIKKYGAKVGPVDMGERDGTVTTPGDHPGFDVTDKMREAVMQGQPLFQQDRGKISLMASGEKIIRLFDKADMSTIIHELSHVWLEELRADALGSGATDQMKADWQTVKDWWKAQGIKVGNKGIIPTEAHELFARGGERYVMEGKAPTSALSRAFNLFRAWLTRIYQVVENLNSPITPQVREVFARLLATQEEIDAQTRLQNVTPLFKSAEEAGMSEQEFADYQARVGEARDEAYNTLLFKTMEAIRRRRLAEQRDQRSNVRSEVAETVGRQPQFVALHLLRTGRWLGDPDRPVENVKLNTGWLIDNFGEDILTKLPRGLPITRGDGLEGDVIAEMVGMASGSELVHALAGMRAASDQLRASGEKRSLRDKMIDEEVERVMAERHGDTLNDGSIEEEAIAALNTAAQGEIISSEIRQLTKRTSIPGRITPYQHVREWAKRKIAAGKVVDVASRSAMQRYTRAAAKASRAAEEAILAGNVDETYRQKQAQLINHALLAESKAAADRIDAIVARMKRLAKRAAMKSVDPDYMDKVHMLLENYDFRPRSQRSIDEQEGFETWMLDQRAKGYEVHIPPRLENRGEPYSRVSVEELEALNDMVESLLHLGKTKQKLKTAQGERDFAEWRDEALAHMQRLPNRKLPEKPINEERRLGASFAAELLKVETLAEELDGGQTGPMNDLLVHGATEAENKRVSLRERVMKPLTQMYLEMGSKQWKRLQDKVTIPELTWNTLRKGDPRIGKTVTMTRMELLTVALNMGNLSNLEKMAHGERWPVGTLKAVVDRELSKADWDFVQSLWTQVEKLWPDIVATEREMSGVVPEKVVNSAIDTRFGTYEGGYWPVVYDAARWQRAEDLEGKKVDDMFGLKSGVATQKGHTIERTSAFGPISYNLENILFNHVEQVVTRISYAPFARGVLRAIRDDYIGGMIDTKLGPEYRKIIEPWLQRQINEGASMAQGARWWSGILRQARINLTIAAMGLRISTGMAQTLGLTASAQRIGAEWVGVGLKTLALNPREATQFVWDRSPEMLHRTENFSREMNELSNRMRQRHRWWTDAQHWAMWHIGMIDRYAVSVPTWLGAHAKGIDQGMTDEEASRFADKSVRMSQGSGREKDLAWVQSMANGEGWRFFTMFYTPFNVLFNAQWQGIRGLRRGDLRPAISVTFWWMLASMLGDAMLSGDWPEEDEEGEGKDWGAWAVRNVIFGMFAGVPLIRDAATHLERQEIGEYSRTGSDPVSRVWDAVDRSKKITETYVEEGETPEKPIKEFGNLASVFTGLPLGQPGVTGQFLWDYSEGEVDPQGVTDWYFGISKGKVPSQEQE